MAIRILVVDDATFIRDMVKRNLREKLPGVEVRDAVDGNRAVAAMKQEKFDLILSDWEMPGMSGEEFLRWVREHPNFSAIPFVMVTSRGDREHVFKAVEAGVSDYISKPFTPEELIKKTLKQLVKIGKDPRKLGSVKGATQGIGGASVDALTGGATPSAPAAKKTAKAPAAQKTKGQAQLRFSGGLTTTCVIREMSLQALNGVISRTDNMPSVFDQTVMEIATDGGDNIARVNGYVQSIAAADQSPNCKVVKIIIRFVDNDAEKFEVLSRFIAKH